MPSKVKKNSITYCFIDASNLFYGGFKKLGWKVDYKLLADYLRKKYCVSKIFYYGGIEMRGTKFEFNPLEEFPILKFIHNAYPRLLQVDRGRAHFYDKLRLFGYTLKLKSVKHIYCQDGHEKTKANCDVDLTLDAVRFQDKYDRIVLLSGDGDFEILLRYMEYIGKPFLILANSQNTAGVLKTRYQAQYRNFPEIRELIEKK